MSRCEPVRAVLPRSSTATRARAWCRVALRSSPVVLMQSMLASRRVLPFLLSLSAVLRPSVLRAQHFAAEPAGVRALAAAPTGERRLDRRAVAVRGATATTTPLLIGAGVLGGAVGLFGGGLGTAWASETRECVGEDCGLWYAILGATAGESLGVPLAMHWAAGRKEGLPTSILGSALVGAAGMALALYW